MPRFEQTIAVEMEDGTSYEVVADQRDLARYEVQDFYNPSRLITAVRFLAYSASLRARKTELAWPKFNAACVSAGDPDGEPVDPTQPGPGGTGSESS